MQTCVLGGVCIFNYFNDIRPALMERVSPHILLSLIHICGSGGLFPGLYFYDIWRDAQTQNKRIKQDGMV